MKKLFSTLALASLLVLTSCGNESMERQTYIDVCHKVVDTMEVEKTQLASLEITEDDFSEIRINQELIIAKTFIYFIELLYINENYPISDKPVYITSNYVKNDKVLQYNEEYLKSSFDKENNKVEIEFLGFSSSDENYKGSENYLCYLIDYDFENSIINGYSVFFAEVNDKQLKITDYQIYDGNKIYDLINYDKSSEIVSEYNDRFQLLSEETSGLELTGDFKEEYIKATNDMLGDDYFEI